MPVTTTRLERQARQSKLSPAAAPPAHAAPPAATGATANPPMPSSLEPTPHAARDGRFQMLRQLVANALASAASAREVVTSSLSLPPDSELATILAEHIKKLRELAHPKDLAGWIRLSEELLALWLALFGNHKPADQGFAHMLHSLTNSVAGPHILARLAQQTHAGGHTDNLDREKFDAIVDGDQTKELASLQVKPHDLIPVVNAVSSAGMLLAARPQPKAPGVATALVLLALSIGASLLPSRATADEILIAIDDSKPVSYLVTVGADKSVVVNPTRVIRPGPSPTPPQPPGPAPVLTPRAKLLKAEADKSVADADRTNTAQGLSLILRELAKAAPTAKDVTSLQDALGMGLDGVLNHQHAQAAWKPFRDQLAKEWVSVGIDPRSTMASYGALLTDAADGCEASIPRASVGTLKQVDPAFWQFLLQLLQIILPLLVH